VDTGGRFVKKGTMETPASQAEMSASKHRGASAKKKLRLYMQNVQSGALWPENGSQCRP